MQYKAEKETWWVATEGGIFHFGKLEDGQLLSTSLENMEIFDTEEEMQKKYPDAKQQEEFEM